MTELALRKGGPDWLSLYQGAQRAAADILLKPDSLERCLTMRPGPADMDISDCPLDLVKEVKDQAEALLDDPSQTINQAALQNSPEVLAALVRYFVNFQIALADRSAQDPEIAPVLSGLAVQIKSWEGTTPPEDKMRAVRKVVLPDMEGTDSLNQWHLLKKWPHQFFELAYPGVNLDNVAHEVGFLIDEDFELEGETSEQFVFYVYLLSSHFRTVMKRFVDVVRQYGDSLLEDEVRH